MAYTQQTPIGTPDVNLITKTLAGLQPDSALQQYAMLHKNNPYILSLAKSESDRRKQLRTAAQGQVGQQPTVVDQNIAGMAQTQLPENQGIAQIPTPNMQRMADGGIAGYEDDEEGMATGGMGGMFNFAQQSEPVVRMSGGGAVQKFAGKAENLVRTTTGGKSWFLDIPKTVRDPSVPYYREIPNPLATLADQKFGSRNEAIQAYNAATQTVAESGPSATVEPSPIWGMGMPMNVGMPAGTDVSALQQPVYVPPSGNKPPAPPLSGNKPPAPSAEKQGLATLAPSKAMTADEAKAQAGDFVDYEGAFTAFRKAESDQESQGARLRTMLADSLPKTPALEGLEKLLDKQDAATGGEKDKAAGLALLSAGLAIAGGSSPFALQNLKEAIPAVTQYGEALKDIKKMERENMKMRGDIEQARRAEGRDDTKLKLQLEEKIGERKDNINKLGIDLTAKIAGTTADVASKLWSTSFEAQNRKEIALFEGQNRKDVAGMQVNAQANAELNKYERLGAADPDSALAKGFQMFKQEAAEPRLYGEYIKLTQDPMNGAAFLQKYPTFAVYKEGYTGGGLQFAPPPDNASILKPPKG
jgi:hypothetical protein